MRTFLAIALLALSAACGDNQLAPIPLAEACTEQANAWCDVWADTQTAAGFDMTNLVGGCMEWSTHDCTDRTNPHAVSVEDQTECLDAIEANRGDLLKSDSVPEVCSWH